MAVFFMFVSFTAAIAWPLFAVLQWFGTTHFLQTTIGLDPLLAPLPVLVLSFPLTLRFVHDVAHRQVSSHNSVELAWLALLSVALAPFLLSRYPAGLTLPWFAFAAPTLFSAGYYYRANPAHSTPLIHYGTTALLSWPLFAAGVLLLVPAPETTLETLYTFYHALSISLPLAFLAALGLSRIRIGATYDYVTALPAHRPPPPNPTPTDYQPGPTTGVTTRHWDERGRGTESMAQAIPGHITEFEDVCNDIITKERIAPDGTVFRQVEQLDRTVRTRIRRDPDAVHPAQAPRTISESRPTQVTDSPRGLLFDDRQRRIAPGGSLSQKLLGHARRLLPSPKKGDE